MEQKIRISLLGICDLILSLGAILTGVMMVSSSNGIFVEYPKEWLHKAPFESWVVPGIITIVVFGLGNIIAAIFSFKKDINKPWLVSAVMGAIFLISLIAQVIILGEYYLATIELFILCIIQLCISGYVFAGQKEVNLKSRGLL